MRIDPKEGHPAMDYAEHQRTYRLFLKLAVYTIVGVVALMAEQSALTPDEARRRLRLGADAVDTAPFDSPAAGYTFDGKREGVVSAPGGLAAP